MHFENRQDEKKRRVKEGHLKKSKCWPPRTCRLCSWWLTHTAWHALQPLLLTHLLHGNPCVATCSGLEGQQTLQGGCCTLKACGTCMLLKDGTCMHAGVTRRRRGMRMW